METVRELEQRIKDDPKAINDIVQILEAAQDAKAKEELRLFAFKAASRTFFHLLENNETYAKFALANLVQGGEEPEKKRQKKGSKNELSAKEVQEVVGAWIRDKFVEFYKLILKAIRGGRFTAPSVCELAKISLLIIEVQSRYVLLHQLHFSLEDAPHIKNFSALVSAILPLDFVQHESLFSSLKERFLIPFDDVRFVFLSAVSHSLKAFRLSDATKDLGERLSVTVLKLVHDLPLIQPHQFFFVLPIDEAKRAKELSDRSGQKRSYKDMVQNLDFDNTVYTLTAQQQMFQSVVFSIVDGSLFTDIPKQLYKRFLEVAPAHILPKLTNPAQLLDFLSTTFKRGGIAAILSLESLFFLITKFNLDVPDFYKRLYSLFEPKLFHAKHAVKLLEMTEIFLSSSHIGEAVIASFVKRLARLTLRAPPNVVGTIFVLLHTLFLRFPSLNPLLHRSTASSGVLFLKAAEVACSEDPFNEDEPDPSLTNASQSSLWEIASARNHYYPPLGVFAKVFDSPIHKFQEKKNISTFANDTFQNNFSAYIRVKHKKGVPLHFEPAKHLFSDKDSSFLVGWDLQASPSSSSSSSV